MNRARVVAIPVAALIALRIAVGCSSDDEATTTTDAGDDVAVADSTPVSTSSSSGGTSSSSGSVTDAYVPVGCLDSDPFVSVDPLALIDTAADELGPALPADESQLLYGTSQFGDAGALAEIDLVFADLADGGVFGAPKAIDPTTAALNAFGTQDLQPTLSPAGTDVVFVRMAEGGATLLTSHRADPVSAFAAPTRLAIDGGSAPYLAGSSENGLQALYFTVGGAVYRAPAKSLASIGAPATVKTTTGTLMGVSAVPTTDESAIYVGIADPGHIGVELYTVKGDAGVTYEDNGVDLGVNVDGYATIPRWISPNRCRLYLVSNRPNADAGGGYDLYVARRKPH